MDQIVEQFLLGGDLQLALPFRYNIAPTQEVAAVRVADASGEAPGVRELVRMRWGLVPSWAKDLSIGNRMINARAESVAEKPAFRAAFRRRRCLILADGYYEWRKEGSKKQPYYIRFQDDAAFGLAGLWEFWRPPEGLGVVSCTIITTDANELTRPIHDRMPVIVAPEDHSMWLDPQFEQREALEALLRPYPEGEMRADPVSTLVNNPRHESADCILPLA